MKKNLFRILFIFFILMTLVPVITHADTLSCDRVADTVSAYYDVEDALEEMDCDNLSSAADAGECNTKKSEKALLLSKIFRYNDMTDTCSKAELTQIVNDNDGECTNLFGNTLIDMKKTVMNIFYILAPFLLLIFGSLDFFKVVVESDPKAMSEHRKKFFKRLLAFVLLFLSPVAINFALNLNLSNYGLDGNVYSCKTTYALTFKTWNSTYIAPKNTGTSSTSGNSNLGLGENNGLFQVRTEKPADGEYYDYSTGFQCVWYARSRAVEALMTSTLSDSEKSSRAEKVRNARGNGWSWYAMSVPGEQSATRDSESSGTLDALVGFQNSDDYTKPRAGSIVSWQWTESRCIGYHNGSKGACYGHVAFVEDVNTETNQVLVSDGWQKNGFGFRSEWYDISYMEHFGGNYNFEGYVYLFDTMKSD